MEGGIVVNRDELLKELTALDFVAVDLHLFLDTHPDNREALEVYNNVVSKANQLRRIYENHCGPLTPNSPSAYPWQWIEDPWPWQYSFNFNLPREECK